MSNEKAFGFKIIVIGAPAVGKTSLIKKYTTGSFQKDYISTLGTQFSKYEEEIEGEKVELFIWDIAGQKTFDVMRRKFYTGSSGAIVVFSHSPNQAESFNRLEGWLDELKEHCGSIPLVLFGNKIDLVDNSELNVNNNIITSDTNVEAFKMKHNILGYYKTSALTGEGVTESFRVLVQKLYSNAKLS